MSRQSLPAIGAVFGAALAMLGLVSAGWGHGSYLTLSLAAAPVSWVPALAVVAAPMLWAGVGVLVRDGNRRIAGLILGGHTVASVGTVALGSPGAPGAEQWQYLAQARGLVLLVTWPGVLLYMLGLCVAWRLVLQRSSGEGQAG